ncbi:hypothetical protein LO80_09205 [Candidatus Francisella endociliophora]|uniref:Pentapeptide repeat-containing protein n=1 Tax=Candidatus Francisella endociliophora TaxID=653937 RepID=A0A097ERC7_9GAMM|nr:pentapeptide repeat-containing protein [Francisella sp. FSC1006]AIT10131.1 hypothetical protein LO80_09205 [Francisella sp. FSC1006]
MSDDKKKKKRPLDDYVANTPTVQEIDHEGEYGPEPEWVGVPQDVDEVERWLDEPVVLHSINSLPYTKIWTKPAYDLIHDEIKNLNKNWQDRSVDSIEHSDTDFTGLDAQGSAIVANTFKEGTDFTNAKFNRAKLHGGKYKNCKFVNNNFASAGIGHLEFENCTFTNAEFGKTDIKKVEFKNCTFDKCSFFSTQFHTSDLYDCTFNECIFNTELWFKNTILNTKFSKSEFNKSQFSGVLIDSVTLVDSSLLKTTFFGTQIQNSDFTNNAWLKVGFANGNSIYKTTLYNENIQQCNFGDSEWKDSELQNSQTLSNDFSKVEMHDTDFTGVNGIGDNFATGLFSNCRFADCDLAQANCTGTDFIVGSSIQNCTLDKLIYAYARLPENFDEGQLKKTSQAQIRQLTDKDVKLGYPSTKAEINTPKATVASVSNGYRYFGTMSLSGDMTVTDTESPISNVTLEQKKVSIENSVSEEIQKWIHNDYGKAPKDQNHDNAAIVDVITSLDIKNKQISIGWKFGNYTFKPEIFFFDGKNYTITGSITKNNDDIAIDKRFISSSSLTIDISLTFMKNNQEAEKTSNNFLEGIATNLKFVISTTGTVVAMIPHPLARGVGLGLKIGSRLIPEG